MPASLITAVPWTRSARWPSASVPAPCSRRNGCGMRAWLRPVVSVGSTPTATFVENLDGVTEVRAGVFLFQDLVMAGIGVCKLEDIAVSVLVSVIGHQPEKGWIITDGGWTSLSRDRGTSSQPVDQGYGVVRDVAGSALRDDLSGRRRKSGAWGAGASRRQASGPSAVSRWHSAAGSSEPCVRHLRAARPLSRRRERAARKS